MHDIVILCFGHLENISLLNYTNILKDNSFHYKTPKLHIISITNGVIKKNKKAFKYCKALQLKVADISFLKFQFSFQSLNIIVGSKHHQLFFS